LLGRYTTDHPDIRKLDAEIAGLEKRVAQSKSSEISKLPPSTELESDPVDSDAVMAKAEMQSQLELLNRQIRQGTQEQERIRKEMVLLQARIDAVPRMEQMQKEITRDYEITRQHYQDLLSKKNEAGMAASLEKRQKGEQFRILDPPSRPEKPSEPNRIKLTLLGGLAGLVLGLGLAMLIELKDDSIRSEHELTRLTNLPVLVSIPMIQVHKLGLAGETTLRKRLQKLLPGGKSDHLF